MKKKLGPWKVSIMAEWVEVNIFEFCIGTRVRQIGYSDPFEGNYH